MLQAHVTVQSQSSTTVVNKDGSTATTTVITSLARAFINADQQPGQFIGATRETLTTTTPGEGHPWPDAGGKNGGGWDSRTTTTGQQAITYGQAVGVIGAEAMARGADEATPGFLSHLFSDGISLRDAKNIVVGGALALCLGAEPCGAGAAAAGLAEGAYELNESIKDPTH
jgi:hypothetical protein